MPIWKVILLAFMQGLTELLPVSSSAHVIVLGRFLGWDASTPEGSFLLVMLHTGTMFAVLLYFWSRWKRLWTESSGAGKSFVFFLCLATVLTGIVGYSLKIIIEKVFMAGVPHAELENLFRNLPLISGALLAAGILILAAAWREGSSGGSLEEPLSPAKAAGIGMVQGLCLPFRGFSRSGATISVAMWLKVSKERAEEFSFALAVILTPPVIARELVRMLKATDGPENGYFSLPMLIPGFIGMVFSFVAGLLALWWLSSWIEKGKWKFFGYYCLVFSAFVFFMHFRFGF